MNKVSHSCYLCGSVRLSLRARIDHQPEGETDYAIAPEHYYREVHQCEDCSVYNNFHRLLDDDMYAGEYNESISQSTSLGGIEHRYQKVMSLPPEKSDNRQRVKRIEAFYSEHNLSLQDTDVLDVGSGTSVFLGAIKDKVHQSACIDPDPVAVEHAKSKVGVDLAYHGTLDDFPPEHNFGLITFNKVLEHVKAPVSMLASISRLLNGDGLVYVELPEGERTAKAGKIASRQEFFVEHYTIYNQDSFRNLCEKAGFRLMDLQVITEPSGKMTIYGFLTRA